MREAIALLNEKDYTVQYEWKHLYAERCYEEGFYRNAELFYSELIGMFPKLHADQEVLEDLYSKKIECLAQQKKFRK